MTGSNGIDVSNNNGQIDLRKGFAGLDFAVAKCTEGTGFADATFSHYQQSAADAGALFHAYHFGHPELFNGEAEAEFFMHHCPPRSGLMIWYDYEVYGQSAAADAEGIDLFRLTIKQAYPHAFVGLYANLTGMHRAIPAHAGYDGLWLAFPNNQVETPTRPMPPGTAWNIHQYEIFAGVDRDYSRWTKAEMSARATWPA